MKLNFKKFLLAKIFIPASFVVGLTLTFVVAGFTTNVRAGILTVTTTADTNRAFCLPSDCSLREAIAVAAPGDEIVFASPLFDSPQTIILLDNLHQLGISKSLTITGNGAHLLTIRRSLTADPISNRYPIFEILNPAGAPPIFVTLSGMTMTNGARSSGAGVFISSTNSNGMLTIRDCHITGNTANSGGGGIRHGSPLTLINSTVSNNIGSGVDSYAALTMINSTVSGNSGSGVFHFSGTSVITNSTITDNQPSAGAAGGGIDRSGGRLTIRSTIVAGNRNNATTPDVGGSTPTTNSRFISEGYNLLGNIGTQTVFNQIGDQTGIFDPLVDPLANYGGTTPTHRLRADSRAVERGNSFGSTTDQRGSARPVDNPWISNADGDGSDIGAYEVQSASTANSISGVVSYAITSPNQIAKFVPGVTLSAVWGASSVSAVTNSAGAYSLQNLTAGSSYTVTPSKTGNTNGITAFDATLVLRHVASGGQGANALNAKQQSAADTDGVGGVTAFDATQILRYVAAGGANANTGQTGSWKFSPVSCSYSALNSSLTNENYEAILVGELNGDWTP
ncbi:MAG: hypothetical protein M3209_08860 [Acidobacteriota bacterium]|nr:hypothetical protein [Acidobacteriota bacterium]